MIELRLMLGTVEGEGPEQVHGTVAPARPGPWADAAAGSGPDGGGPADVPFAGWLELLSVLERFVQSDAVEGNTHA